MAGGTALNPQAWSSTAASNDGADSAIGAIADSSSPDVVDNWSRGIMAGVRNLSKDLGGFATATGTANAHVVASAQQITSAHLTDGYRIAYYAPATNTAVAVTVAIDGLTAAGIKRADGSALAIGSIVNDQILDLVYESGASVFRAVNIAPSGSGRASFSAHKGGSNQTGVVSVTDTKVTLGTEVYDVGSFFATSRWTPPAGTCALMGEITSTGNQTTGNTVVAEIYKNGSLFKVGNNPYSTNGTTCRTAVSIQDQCNGTDFYELYVNIQTASTGTISGTSTDTWFMGTMI